MLRKLIPVACITVALAIPGGARAAIFGLIDTGELYSYTRRL